MDNGWTIFSKLGGVKVGFCLLAFIVAVVLFALAKLSEDGFIYTQTFCILTAVGGNLAGMGIHAFGKNKQA